MQNHDHRALKKLTEEFLDSLQSKSSPAKGKEEEFGSGLITVSVVTRRLLSSASLTPAADDKHKSQGRSSFGGEVVPKQDSLLVYKVTLPRDASIKDLQRRIERVVTEDEEHKSRQLHKNTTPRRHINWRSVWRSTDLDYEGVRLVAGTTQSSDSSNLKLADFGITATTGHGPRIRFVRRKFHQKATTKKTSDKLMSSARR